MVRQPTSSILGGCHGTHELILSSQPRGLVGMVGSDRRRIAKYVTRVSGAIYGHNANRPPPNH